MTRAQHRTRLRRLARQRQTVEAARREASRAAHAAGLSYAEIATALGLASRMHAHRLANGRTDQ